MSQSTLTGDVYVAGNFSSKSLTPPAGSINDAAVQGNAGIQASKLQHQFEAVYAQPSASAAVTEQKVTHVVKGGTATLLEFAAAAVVLLTGNDTCTIDLLKNGVSILTAAIALAAGDTIRTLKTAAGYTTTSLVAGDVLEVKVTYTHLTGTAPQGVFARTSLREDAQ